MQTFITDAIRGGTYASDSAEKFLNVMTKVYIIRPNSNATLMNTLTTLKSDGTNNICENR